MGHLNRHLIISQELARKRHGEDSAEFKECVRQVGKSQQECPHETIQTVTSNHDSPSFGLRKGDKFDYCLDCSLPLSHRLRSPL